MLKDIPGYEGLYQISKDGDVFSVRSNKYLKPKVDKDGYLEVTFSVNKVRKTYRVHRLVALTYLPNPNNHPIINHIDGNKSNNSIDNLEWCTVSYNTQYEFTHRNRKAHNRKYYIDVYLNNTLIEKSLTVFELISKYPTSTNYIDKLLKRDLKDLRYYNFVGKDGIYEVYLNGDILYTGSIEEISKFLGRPRYVLLSHLNKPNHISKYKIVIMESND